jgi:hypothetical protein
MAVAELEHMGRCEFVVPALTPALQVYVTGTIKTTVSNYQAALDGSSH